MCACPSLSHIQQAILPPMAECHYDEKSLAREGDIRNGECVFNQCLPALVCSPNHKVNNYWSSTLS